MSITITVVHSQTSPLSEQIMEPLGFNGNFHKLELGKFREKVNYLTEAKHCQFHLTCHRVK